jgi:hypothetical protein
MPRFQWRKRADQLTPQALGGLEAEEAAHEFQVFMDDIEHATGTADATGTGSGWSDKVLWTPRMAAMEYLDTGSWLEPDYGTVGTSVADYETIIEGFYRLNGTEVDAHALIVVGDAWDNTAPYSGWTYSDLLVYLSLPLPVADQFPTITGAPLDGSLQEGIYNYSRGYWAAGRPLGEAVVAGTSDPQMAAGGTLILPAYSESQVSGGGPDWRPPEDIASWVSVVTYGYNNDADYAGSLWQWRGGSPAPVAWPLGPLSDDSDVFYAGNVISWHARYFTTAEALSA